MSEEPFAAHLYPRALCVLESVATIAVSALAEDKLRRYLLLGAIGMLCLFCLGFTEAI
jgi:hypothetical protein